MKQVSYNSKELTTSGLFKHIDNYGTLGSMLGLPPRIMSYCRKFKHTHKLQTLVKLKDRKTYKSSKQLGAIQRAIKDLLAQKIFNSLKTTEHILAYKKGFDYKKALQTCVDNSIQISYDIRKCYDSITYKHIVNMLQHYGFTHRGAKLVAGYCVVQRKGYRGKEVNTLQQGSRCSPIISNLVLNLILDEPIMLWLDNYITRNNLIFTYKYFRYSDNVVLFINNNGTPLPLDFIKEYKEKYRELLNTKGIYVHDEFITPNNHPFRNQRFLGIVLNKVARIELKEFSKIRAILFNCCRNGLHIEAEKYVKSKVYDYTCQEEQIPYTEDELIEKFRHIMGGKLSYIKSISVKQFTQLTKLYRAAAILHINRKDIYSPKLDQPIFNLVKTSGDFQESIENFQAKITQIIQPDAPTEQPKTTKLKPPRSKSKSNLSTITTTTDTIAI